MERLTFYIIFVLIVAFSFSTRGQNWLWAKDATGTGQDESPALCTDATGNVFAAGSFHSPTITFGSITLTNTDTSNIFIVKYDANGNVLWAKGTGGTGTYHNLATSIRADSNGNVFVTGYFETPTLTFGSITLTNPGGGCSPYPCAAIFIAKYDSNGNVLWAKCSSSQGRVESIGISTDNAGNVFITGHFWYDFILDFDTLINNYSGPHVFIAKCNANGNVLWARTKGASDAISQGYAVNTDAGGNAFVTGWFSSYYITFGSYTLTATQQNAFLVKYDPTGNVLWAKKPESMAWNVGYSVNADAGGNVFVTGFFTDSTIAFDAITLKNIGGSCSSTPCADMFIAKYDVTGNVLWAKCAGGTNWDMGNSVSTDLSGNLYVTGSFKSPTLLVGSTSLAQPGGSFDPMFIVKYDATGNVICASALSSGGRHRNGLSADPLSKAAYISGDFRVNPFILGSYTLPLTGQANVFVGKYSCNSFITTIAQNNPNCHGQCTGTATATPLGGTSPYTYSWSNAQATQTATGLCAGTYTVDILDANNNSSSAIITITHPIAITLSVTATDFCLGSSGSAAVNVSGGAPVYSYNWSNGQTTSAITGLSAGNYSLLVTDTKGCTNTTTISITALPIPTAIVTGSTFMCSGQSTTFIASGGISYVWSTGSTMSSISVAPTTNTTYSVSVSNGACADDTSITVTVNPLPVILISGNTNLCFGQTTTLSASGGGTYLWTTGETSNTIFVSPSATTSYSLTVTGPNGCQDNAIVPVIINQYPVASISASTTICSGNTITLIASGGANYIWSTGSTTSFIQATPYTSANYSVIVANGNCKDTAYTFVTVNPTPVATTSGNVSIFQGESVTLNAGGGTNYVWSTGETTTSITVTPTVTTVYCAIVAYSNNCKDTACATVTVESSCFRAGSLLFPNAFSPNEDGENDFLRIYYGNMSCIESLRLIIYDRWGQRVYETADPNFSWDGKYHGKIMDTKVFVCYLSVRFTDGKEINKKTNVSLMR